MPPKKPKHNPYDASQISALTPREHVRCRPGMYMGGVDKRALHNMLWLIMDEALDEAQFYPLSEITIAFLTDTTIKVSDDGMGLPIAPHTSGKPILEAYMTDLGLSRRNYIKNRSSDLSGGLHATHLYMMNALTSTCIIETKHAGHLWRQTYSEGYPTSAVEPIRSLATDEKTGTSITFTPDFTIMDKDLTFDYDRIVEHCQELAYLLPHITFRVERTGSETSVLNEPQGIANWLPTLNAGVPTLHPILSTELVVDYEYPIHKGIATIRVNLVFQFREHMAGMIKSYVNTWETSNSGVHVEGLQKGLVEAIYGNRNSGIEDPLYGLAAVLHVYHSAPDFAYFHNQLCFCNAEVAEIVSDGVQFLLAENPDVTAYLQGYFQKRKGV